MDESSINFPKDHLAKDIWSGSGDTYVLNGDVKDKINSYIDSYDTINLRDYIDGVYIVGSIGTNLYDDTTDIDVHLQANDKFDSLEDKDEISDELKAWSHKNPLYVNEHPLELYMQLDDEQDKHSDSLYDVFNDEWIVGPLFFPLDYNPYNVFSEAFSKVSELASDLDINVGELRRDIIDLDRLKAAAEKLPKDKQDELIKWVDSKTSEVEGDIETLVRDIDSVKLIRREFNRSDKRWNDNNAMFKMFDVYGYFKLGNILKDTLRDDDLTPDEIEDIKGVTRILDV